MLTLCNSQRSGAPLSPSYKRKDGHRIRQRGEIPETYICNLLQPHSASAGRCPYNKLLNMYRKPPSASQSAPSTPTNSNNPLTPASPLAAAAAAAAEPPPSPAEPPPQPSPAEPPLQPPTQPSPAEPPLQPPPQPAGAPAERAAAPPAARGAAPPAASRGPSLTCQSGPGPQKARAAWPAGYIWGGGWDAEWEVSADKAAVSSNLELSSPITNHPNAPSPS